MKLKLSIGAFFSFLVLSVFAFGAASSDRLKNTVIVGDGVAGTKSMTFDIGGSNPLIRSSGGVLGLSTDGTNIMAVPAAADTIVGKATTDIFTNKSIGGLGVGFNGSTSGTTTVKATAAAGTTTLTLPAATDTLVGKATTDTMTNKTLTSAAINGGTLTSTGVAGSGLTFSGSSSGSTVVAASAAAGSTTLTLPAVTDTLVGKTTTDTLTNKTLTSPALTGTWTATGNLTQTNSSGITNLHNANGSSATNSMILRTGNSTTSNRNAYVEYDTSESSGQTWDAGLVGDQNFTIQNQTTATNRLAITPAGVATFTGKVVANGGASGGIALTANGASSQYTTQFANAAASGSSFGVLIQAGGNSSDGALVVQNRVGSPLFQVRGDGAVTITNSGGNVPFACTVRNSGSASNSTSSIGCSAGEIVVGGGCVSSGAVNLRNSYPVNSTTWGCDWNSSSTVTSYAICCAK